MIKRILQQKLKTAAEQYPVVTLTGPRQSGKTTLAGSTFPNYAYVSLEEPDQREFALEDPRGFLERFGSAVVIDEVQRVPKLFSYIQTIVDQRDIPGQYILTGSQNFLLLQTISQSLAGRCAVLHLMPFSLSEIQGRKPFPVEDIGFKLPSTEHGIHLNMLDVLLTGFYPRIHDKGLDPGDWLSNYYQTYIERDVRDILNVGDIEAFSRFVRLCAGRNGQILNLTSLGNDCGITHTTAKRWISILETSFIILLLRPHHKSFSKRLIKSPKIYFLDTGMLCYLLRIRSPEDLRISPYYGNVFESYVISELFKNYLNRGLEAPLYFWRDSSGNEIDIIIDRGNQLIPVEIKAGQTVAADYFKGISFWRRLIQNPQHPSGVVYGGDASFKRSDIFIYAWSVF